MKWKILKMRSGKIYMDKILKIKMLVGNVYIHVYKYFIICKIYILD